MRSNTHTHTDTHIQSFTCLYLRMQMLSCFGKKLEESQMRKVFIKRNKICVQTYFFLIPSPPGISQQYFSSTDNFSVIFGYYHLISYYYVHWDELDLLSYWEQPIEVKGQPGLSAFLAEATDCGPANTQRMAERSHHSSGSNTNSQITRGSSVLFCLSEERDGCLITTPCTLQTEPLSPSLGLCISSKEGVLQSLLQ